MLAPGLDPAHLSTEKNYVWSTESRIGDIDGRPAYEVKQPAQADPFVVVAWQYADNGWGLACVGVDPTARITVGVIKGGSASANLGGGPPSSFTQFGLPGG